MGFPKAIAQAQKGSLLSDIRGALDFTESVHRGLQQIEGAHLVDLMPSELASVQDDVKTAYEALARARQTIEGRER